MDTGEVDIRVLLIDPRAAERGYNLGLAYLCSSLRVGGHEPFVLDLNNVHREKPLSLVRRVVEKFRPGLIGISGVSWAFKSALKVARYIRTFSRVPLVQGGIHASLVKEKILDHPEFDMVVVGEGEETIVELVNALEGDGELRSVPGLIFRARDRVVINEDREPIGDLDLIPFPDFRPFGLRRIYSYPLLTSRGCPYTCTFCLSPILSGRRWRARSPQNIVAELEHAITEYGIRSFNVRDDNLTLWMDRAKEFCDLLAAENLGLKWSCNNGIFARWVDEELAGKMKRAGCVEVSLGVESLVPEIFEEVRKGEQLTDIQNAVRALKGAGVRIRGFFILGLPHDTYENSMLTFRLARELGLDDYGWNTLLPFPGTGAGEWVRENGRLRVDDVWDVRHGDIPFETDDFSAEERDAAYRHIAVSTGNYAAFYNYDRSIFHNMMPMTRLIISMDPKHVVSHTVRMARKFLRSSRFVPCEGAHHLRGVALT